MEFAEKKSLINQTINFFMPKDFPKSLRNYEDIRTFWIVRITLALILTIFLASLSNLVLSIFLNEFHNQIYLSFSILIPFGILLYLFRNTHEPIPKIILSIWAICLSLILRTLLLNDEISMASKWFPILIVIPAFLNLKKHLIPILLIAVLSIMVVFLDLNPLTQIIHTPRNPIFNFIEYLFMVIAALLTSQCIASCNRQLQMLVNDLSRQQMENEISSLSDSTLSSLREMAYSVATEFKEPVSTVKNELNKMDHALSNSSIKKENVDDFVNATENQIAIIAKLTMRMNQLAHTQQNKAKLERIALTEMLVEVKKRLSQATIDRQVECNFILPMGPVILRCDAPRITNAVMLTIAHVINSSELKNGHQVTCTFSSKDNILEIDVQSNVILDSSISNAFEQSSEFDFALNLIGNIVKLHHGKLLRGARNGGQSLNIKLPVVETGEING
jgi:hypothetical protein